MDNNPNNQPPVPNQPQQTPPVVPPLNSSPNPLPTPQPFPPQQPDANFIVPPPDSQKPKRIILVVSIVLGVLLLATIGVLAYLLVAQPQTTTTTTTQPTVDKQRPQKIIAHTKTALTKAFEKNPNFTITTTDSTNSPVYKAVDSPFGVGSDAIAGVSISVSPTPFSDAYLKNISLVIDETLASEAGIKKVTVGELVSYQDDIVTCQTFYDNEAIKVYCANVADYENVINAMKPFAEAYLASNEGRSVNASPIFHTPLPKITKKAGGYSNAVVDNITLSSSPTGGFRGLFYAKDDNWIFWQGTQEIVACTSYNTNDLQHAFEGDPCLDSAGQTASVTISLR